MSRCCARALHSLHPPVPDIRLRAGDCLVIPLAALPLACWCSAGAGVSLFACVVQLIGRNQAPLAVALLTVLGMGATAARRDLWLRGPHAPVRLELGAEGQVRVYCRTGLADRVRVQPHSLRIGRGLLLVLRGRRSYRLWLSRGNVEPATLAALHRRLGRGAAGPPGLR